MTQTIGLSPKISVIIRTKNEERYLSQVLEMLISQTFQDFEIIIVDDNSIDKTCEIAQKYQCKIISIEPGKFSHPYSCNLGATEAKGKYLVYLNGHSIPMSQTFLEDGLRNFEQNLKIAGIYAMPVAHKDGTFTDKFLYNIQGYTIGILRYDGRKIPAGLLGTTNAMIRRDLWEQYHFPETVNDGWGGEDSAWAKHFINLGYLIIHDPKFKVYHSHHLKFRDYFWQIKNWMKMNPYSDTKPEKQRKYF